MLTKNKEVSIILPEAHDPAEMQQLLDKLCSPKPEGKHCQRNTNRGLSGSHANLDQISSSESSKSQLNTSILTKFKLKNHDQTSASKSRLSFKFKILTKPCTQSLNKNLAVWPNFSFQSCTKHVSQHQHQQQ